MNNKELLQELITEWYNTKNKSDFGIKLNKKLRETEK